MKSKIQLLGVLLPILLMIVGTGCVVGTITGDVPDDDVIDFLDDEFLEISAQELDERLSEDPEVSPIENRQGIASLQLSENRRIHLGTSITDDYYVPQGVASSCEAQSSCNDETVYVSMYWKHTNGKTAHRDYNPSKTSIVVGYDVSQKQQVSCFKLEDYSHVGGIAFYRDPSGNEYLYVSGGLRVKKYAIPSGPTQTAACTDLTPQNSWQVKASSFISYAIVDGEKSLLVGRYCKKSRSTSACHYRDGSRARPYAYQYLINSDGDIQRHRSNGTGDDYYNEWKTKYRLPYKAQGVDIVHDDDIEYMVTSTSSGKRPSQYLQDKLHRYDCPYGKSCSLPSSFYESVKQRYLRGGEDLAATPAGVWSVSESAAKYYLKSWGGTGLPFVYRLN